MNRELFNISMNQANVFPGDSLMVHGDAIVAAQLAGSSSINKINGLIDLLIDYLGPDGTLIVPTFTYSFTNSEVYDINESASKVGLFSEAFRLRANVIRSKHPLFSICACGEHSEYYADVNLGDAFGENSIFDKMYKRNAKIMNLGCEFMMTFLHYVEQSNQVTYRYFKDFSGFLLSAGAYQNLTTRYYVGDLSVQYDLELSGLQNYMVRNGNLKVVPFGRFASYTTSARSLYHDASLMLKLNEYSLICERHNNQRDDNDIK